MPDGTLQEGFWVQDMFQPAGRILYSNGDVYEGGLENGKHNGKGVLK
jgi:hypothetical protein